MNQKRRILSICVGILAILLLISIGSAEPIGEQQQYPVEGTYVHVIHIYDGVPVGMTDDLYCDENDIVPRGCGTAAINLKDKINPTYNGKLYKVDKIELHEELREIEIQMTDDYYCSEGDYQPLARETVITWMNFPIQERDIYPITGLHPRESSPYNIPDYYVRKTIEMWLAVLYPLTGEITYPESEDPNQPYSSYYDSLDTTNPEIGEEHPTGIHFVMKIFYSSTGGQRSSSGDRVQVTFYPNDGSNPIITPVSRGAYVSVPTNFASRNTITGWYTDDGSFADAWNFGTDKVTQDMALYAKSSSTGGERTNEQGADGQGTSGQGGDGTGGQEQGATPNPNPNQNDDQNPPQNRLLLILFIFALFGLIAIGIYLWKKNQT